MEDREYNRCVNECRENSCYHCVCNGTQKCYKNDLGIKDFPSRYFKQLTEKEQEKIRNFSYGR